ncbi:MAG TPA: hypothetical protein VJB14_03130 [Planctomycetota bacterium]|nr:hypothetical protein [Planctomycetota bacterium]
MIHILPLLFLGACCGAAPQDKKSTVQATASEIAADEKEKKPPGFLCEGTAEVPDGYRIDIYTYFGKPEKAAHIKQAALLVKGGKFSAEFSVFTKKNLAGKYILRVTLDPNLQPARFQNIPGQEVDVVLNVGNEADAAADRKAFGEGLIGDMKALVALAEESRQKHLEGKGKLDAATWNSLMKDWTRRAGQINKRVLETAEYRVLGFSGIMDTGFEHLTGIVMDLCRCASRGEEKDMREGRERLDVMVSGFEDKLRGTPPDPKKVRVELVNSARGFLQDTVYASGDRAPLGRKRYIQTLFELNKIAPPETRPVILELSASAGEIFDLLDAKKDARPLLEKLDARLGELEKALQNAK